MEIKNVPVNGIIAIARDACRNKPGNPQCLMTIFITWRCAGLFTPIWMRTSETSLIN